MNIEFMNDKEKDEESCFYPFMEKYIFLLQKCWEIL